MSSKKRTPGRYRKASEADHQALDEKFLKNITKDEAQGLVVPGELNPHGFSSEYKAVCYTCDRSLSPSWRSTQRQAEQDEEPHLPLFHWTEIVTRYVR